MNGTPTPVPSAPPLLGIDTATPYLSLALWAPGRGLLARRAERVERDHAARLPGELRALFASAGLDGRGRAPVAGIVVGTGPGSYTGLRVGVASARGLARGWGVPLAGGDTLAAMAATAFTSPPPSGDASAPSRVEDEEGDGGDGGDGGARGAADVWSVIDARRGNVYAGRYRPARGAANDDAPPTETVEAPHKRPRASLPSDARIVEGVAPDAAALARSFALRRPPEPRYL